MADVVRFPTPVFRISFPALFKPESYDGGEPKFGCAAVWTPGNFSDKEKALWSKIRKALDAESTSVFGKKLNELPANIRRGLRDGAEKADMEGYGDGTKFANLTTKMRPGLVDRFKKPIILESEKPQWDAEDKEYSSEDVYPGCYCRGTVTVYSYNNKGKGVALGLMNLQKVRDGERLDSRSDAAADFDDDFLEDDDDDTGFLDD